jgi:hypothetical protein
MLMLRLTDGLIWCGRPSCSRSLGQSVVLVFWAWHQGYEVGTTLLWGLAASIGIEELAPAVADSPKAVWEPTPSKDMDCGHRAPSGTREMRGSEQLEPDVAQSHEDGLQWRQALLLGSKQCVFLQTSAKSHGTNMTHATNFSSTVKERLPRVVPECRPNRESRSSEKLRAIMLRRVSGSQGMKVKRTERTTRVWPVVGEFVVP